ncbi:MAG: hypothetical protein KDK01_13840 [Rhodobacteraceae bacterium]|jgi:hypothetical protein|nr:hypothetical protein [Paracoccaceae bacterium]
MKLISDLTVSAQPFRHVQARSPSHAFAAGEVGCWFDPSDLTTLFADAAGTIPAVIGGRVARMDDKSGNGMHALQANSWAQPFLGRHPASGLRNHKTNSQTYAAWTDSGTTRTMQPTGARDGGPAVTILALSNGQYVNAGTTFHRSFVGEQVIFSVDVKSVTASSITFYLGGYLNNFGATFVFNDGSFTAVSNRISATSAVELGGGWWRVAITTSDLVNPAAVLLMATHANASFIAAYMQAEPGPTPTAYQSVVGAFNIVEQGQHPVHYLHFDGVDDAMHSGLNGLGRNDISAAICCAYASHGGSGYVLNASGDVVSAGDRSFNLLHSVPSGHAELRIGGSAGETLNPAHYGPVCVSARWNRPASMGQALWGREGLSDLSIGTASQDMDLRIGARVTGGFFSGRFYGLIARRAATDPATLGAMRAYLCNKAGVSTA